MKTIKIFLASSEDMENDRMAFGNLVRRLDKIYEKRGIRVELFEWEDYDASYNAQRKQDEYNEQIKASDLFLALFHTKAGKFTIEEFNVATEEFRKKAAPKVYVYCRDIQQGETESPELTEFKKQLFDEMGHYWCRYGNRDTMQLHFVMQLQLVESNRMDSLKVEENGSVTLDGAPVARMDQLTFAAGNEAYQKMSAELQELPDKIEKARQRLQKFPDDEDLIDDLQAKLNHYNQLKEDFAKLQQDLFSTAKTIASLQLQQVSAMLRRAIEAFESGNLERANALLDEIAHEAEHHMERLEQERILVHQDIDAFQLQAKTIMADVNIPIEERVDRVIAIYAKADDWAQRSAYDKEKYIELLSDYGGGLYSFACYSEAEKIVLRLLAMTTEVKGKENTDTAIIYKYLGQIYHHQGQYDKALDYFSQAHSINKHISRTENDETASIYNCFGVLYNSLGDYKQSLEYYRKALDILKQIKNDEDDMIASIYANIGSSLMQIGDFNNALKYYQNALSITEEIYGTESPDTALIYDCIGSLYEDMGEYNKSLEYHFKGLEIYEQTLGKKHPDVATTYNNIGSVYNQIGDFNKALEFFEKALTIQEQVIGTNHADTARCYSNIGYIHLTLGDNKKALQYLNKARTVWEQTLGINHPDTASVINNIGLVYYNQGQFQQALNHFEQSIDIREKSSQAQHPDTAQSYCNIGVIYAEQGDYNKSLEYLEKGKAILINTVGPNHPNTEMITQYVNNIKKEVIRQTQSNSSKGGFWSWLFGD